MPTAPSSRSWPPPFPSEQTWCENPNHLGRLPSVVPDQVGDGRPVMDAVAGVEPVLDAVDAEHECTRKHEREFLSFVCVVVARVACLTGGDRHEQGLERTLEAGGAELPVGVC